MTKPTVLLEMKPSALDYVKEKDLFYVLKEDKLEVAIDDVPTDYVDGTYSDPVKEICDHWGFNKEDVINWEID